MTRYAQILSTGSYVPERVVTNAEIDELLGESTSQWLTDNVGIHERRWMSDAQTTSDLIVEAPKTKMEELVRVIEDVCDTPNAVSSTPPLITDAAPSTICPW